MQTLSVLSLLSFLIPAGSELYIDDSTIYAERDRIDFTLSLFEDALAHQAIGEFTATHQDPEAARAGVAVQSVETSVMGAYPMVTIDYTKPALIATLTDTGEVKAVPGIETTRQVYIDLGAQQVVLTTWTKRQDADIAAVSDALVATIKAPPSADEAGALVFTLDGKSPQSAAETMTSAPLPLAARVEIDARP